MTPFFSWISKGDLTMIALYAKFHGFLNVGYFSYGLQGNFTNLDYTTAEG